MDILVLLECIAKKKLEFVYEMFKKQGRSGVFIFK